MLAAYFNAVSRLEAVLKSWGESQTTLLYKNGYPGGGNQQLVAHFSRVQKGFLQFEGCY